MQNKKLSLIILFFLIWINSIYAFEYNWGKEYKITVRQVSDFVSELKIIETKTNRVIHESLNGMHYVIKTKRKKVAGKDIVFIQSTTGGEGMVSSNLDYFYMEGKKLRQGIVEDIINFNLRDLDGDKNKELILTDFEYYKFKINHCYNALEPDPHYAGKLLPIIYKFQKDKFVEEKNNKELIKNYLGKLERKLLKKKRFKNINGYSHYYATAKKIGLEKQALLFFKTNNSDFTFSCENTAELNPKGKSFQWKTDYYQFFKKYGKEIAP